MDKNSKFMVIGKEPTAVSAIARNLNAQGYNNLISPNLVEIENDEEILSIIKEKRPRYLFFKAGYCPNDSHYYIDVLETARTIVEKLIFIADLNVYPSNVQNPIKEDKLLSGTFRRGCLYAPSHISGLLACDSFRRRFGVNYQGCVCSTIYGVEETAFFGGVSHIIYKFFQAIKEGLPKITLRMDPDEQKDYFFTEDFGSACVFLMGLKEPLPGFINVGAGQLVSNEMIVSILKRITEYPGEIVFDKPKKDPEEICPLLDCQDLQNLGWMARCDFISGLKYAYEDFLSRHKN